MLIVSYVKLSIPEINMKATSVTIKHHILILKHHIPQTPISIHIHIILRYYTYHT